MCRKNGLFDHPMTVKVEIHAVDGVKNLSVGIVEVGAGPCTPGAVLVLVLPTLFQPCHGAGQLPLDGVCEVTLDVAQSARRGRELGVNDETRNRKNKS